MCLVGRRTSHHNNNMHSVSKRIEIELELFYSSLTHSIFFSLFIYFPFLSFCLWSKYNSFLFQYVERIFFRSSEMQLTLNGPKREAQTSKRSQEGERPSEADNQNLNSKVKSRKSKKRGSPKRETDSFCVYDECHLKGAHTTTLTFQWGGGGRKKPQNWSFVRSASPARTLIGLSFGSVDDDDDDLSLLILSECQFLFPIRVHHFTSTFHLFVFEGPLSGKLRHLLKQLSIFNRRASSS